MSQHYMANKLIYASNINQPIALGATINELG